MTPPSAAGRTAVDVWPVVGQAYSLPLPSGAVDVYAVIGHSEDRRAVWVVFIGTRLRPGDALEIPASVPGYGVERDVETFASVMLPWAVRPNGGTWPRRQPRVSLPEVEGIIAPR